MSWFKRDSSLRTSFGRRSPSKSKPPDPDACFESFKKHCQQACSIIDKHEEIAENENSNTATPTVDDVTIALSNLDQMVTLLIQENKSFSKTNGLTIGPMLDYLMTEGILDKLYLWSFKTGEFCNDLKLEQLKIYEVLLSHSAHELLVHKPVLRPLLKLLASCKECAPVEVEKRLIVLLNQLCVSLTQNTNLLEYFFSASNDQGSARFLIFSLLIPFVHRERGIGQQARDALLLCMSLSRKNENIGLYIANSSNFCPVLATGLSALYSRLPRKLDIKSDDWCCLSNEDVQEISELQMFMNSLEFCNAVIQVSHPKVQEQLLDYLYQGFLVPVLGPALHQDTMGVPVEGMTSSSKFSSSMEEIETATAYLNLFIKTITDPALIHAFLRFILTEKFDEQIIISTLISRINTHPRLSLINMSLFKTLLDLNCEDVMLELVFKYLIPCNHVMVSQRFRLKDSDIYNQTTLKLLALVPTCCNGINKYVHSSSPSSNRPIQSSQSEYSLQSIIQKSRKGSVQVSNHNSHSSSDTESSPRRNEDCVDNYVSSYMKYLYDAKVSIQKCVVACKSWSGIYDGDENSLPKENCAKATRQSSYLANADSCDHENKLENGSIKENILPDTVDLSSKEATPSTESFDVESDSEVIPDFWTVLTSCQLESISDLESSVEKLNHLLKGDSLGINGKLKERVARASLSSPNSLIERKTSLSGLQQRRTLSNVDKTRNLSYHSYKQSFGDPDIGPFLSVLFTKLENMMNNSIFVNLQLTGLIVRLAMYPQPLLKSFLLSHNLVFQPTVRSLLQVLASVKHKLDTFSYTEASFPEMLMKARQFLQAREEQFFGDSNGIAKSSSHMDFSKLKNHRHPTDSNHPENRRRSLSNFFFRRGTLMDEKTQPTIPESALESISDGQGYRYVNRKSKGAPDVKLEWLKTRNAVLCAIVLEEFVKELAAISQEHLIADEENVDFISIL